MALPGWVSWMQGGGEHKKSSPARAYPQDSDFFFLCVCAVKKKGEEGEARERDAGWSFEMSLFLLQAAGRQVGW